MPGLQESGAPHSPRYHLRHFPGCPEWWGPPPEGISGAITPGSVSGRGQPGLQDTLAGRYGWGCNHAERAGDPVPTASQTPFPGGGGEGHFGYVHTAANHAFILTERRVAPTALSGR